MRILDHPLVEQTGEIWQPDGKLFAPELRWKAKTTVGNLRTAVRSEIVPLAIEDFTAGNMRAFFVDADASIEPGYAERAFDDSHKQIVTDASPYLYMRGTGGFADTLHSHIDDDCVLSTTTEDGNLPSSWVLDDEELVDCILSSSGDVDGQFRDELQELLRSLDDGVSPNERARAITKHMEKRHDRGGKHQQMIVEINRQTMPKLENTTERIPRIGRINGFAPDAIHTCNWYEYEDSDKPGELVVDFC